MFGQRPTFGAPTNTGFGATTGSAFGTNPAPAFGSTTQTAAGGFGAPSATPSLWGNNQPAQPSTGGLFGAQSTAAGTGLFGSTTATQAGGAFGSTTSSSMSFGGTGFGNTSTFKPAGFGSTSFGAATSQPTATSGGLFGAATSQANAGSLFKPAGTAGVFGSPATQAGGGLFGAGAQQQTGTTIKFNPPTGTDTMMKSGTCQNITTRSICITCMKEYENKSLEELRCEDYLANRKGPQAGGAAPAAGGLFGSTQPQATTSQPGGLFGSTQPATGGGLFGQTQNKPLFGTSASTGFGGTTTNTFGAPASGGFGAPTSQPGGLFGSKPTAFGAPQPASTSTGFSFGQPAASSTAGGLFGQQAKPFGATTSTSQPGGLFGSTAPAFGAAGTAGTSAFGQPAAGGFGQPAPNQSIGLFGNQQKPAGFGTPFGATPASSAPPFGGGFGTASTTNTFGQAAAKPAFGGFGATGTTGTSFGQPATGGFGATSTTGGGLFGAQKPPTLSFGATTSQPSSGFGSFGATTGGFGQTSQAGTTGGLFGATQPKPGGLFGSSGTTGFGATGGFGQPTGATSFGAGTSFGGLGSSFGTGASFGAGLGTANQPLQGGLQPQGQQSQIPVGGVQDYLVSLTSNPYGDDPLFKHIIPGTSDDKLSEVLKPTSSIAQKAALANRYKISPHRNIRVKPKSLNLPTSSDNNSGNKSLFDGLEDDEDVGSKNDLFIPRSSVKKLVLKPKPSPSTIKTGGVSGLINNHNITNDESHNVTLDSEKTKEDVTIVFPSVKDKNVGGGIEKENAKSLQEDSFSALNTRKKPVSGPLTPDVSDANITLGIPIAGNRSPSDSVSSGREELHESSDERHPAGVILKRPQYYTIPDMNELAVITDNDGNCLVENFTVGRHGYGNVFFPGMTNIRNLNLDEIVFFRNKEVIVYPDDSVKPALGEGLNKKAQVTLDKVWPIDKTKKEPIKNPEKLLELNYEEKLQRACIKLGAKFVEYRPETGSWVFKVEHFSKYGLEDSDDENDGPANNQVKKAPQPIHIEKRMKTQEKTKGKVITAIVHKPPQKTSLNLSMSAVPQENIKNIVVDERVRQMKATLFESDDDMDVLSDGSPPPNVDISKVLKTQAIPSGKPRPVILEQRTEAPRRESFIEDIAHSLLTGSTPGKGLGGSFSFSPGPANLPSSLLRTQYHAMATAPRAGKEQNTSTASKRLARHTLHAGYDKYVTLKSSGSQDQRPKIIVPRHSGKIRPLSESLFADKFKSVADSALLRSRSFRVGWSSQWTWSLTEFDGVIIQRQQVVGQGTEDVLVEEQLVHSLQCLLEISLENSKFIREGDVPKFEVVKGLEMLHAHASDVERQIHSNTLNFSEDFRRNLVKNKQVWDLLLALWGKLDMNYPDEKSVDGPESHDVTMRRKELVSQWLERVVGFSAEQCVRKAKTTGKKSEELLMMLSGNNLEQVCDRAQESGDHYTALMMSVGSGGNSYTGQLMLNYLDLLQEAKADKYVDDDRLKIFSLMSGTPVWPASDDKMINACEDLDWLRSFAVIMWFICTPVSSIGDSLLAFEDAFKGLSQYGEYCKMPVPDYALNKDLGETYDIKYHLLKLYADRSHPLEKIVVPTTYTSNHLDQRLGWFVSQVLQSLGYNHMAVQRKDQQHIEFASQLESINLWQWSVFVLLHLSDPAERKSKIVDVMGRNLRLNDEESDDKEHFILENLNLPLTWIAKAKAIRASFEGNHGDEAWYLIKAEEWNAAHSVIVKEIAPDAIINDNTEYLFQLLSELAKDEVSGMIMDWQNEGGVFYDFLNVDNEVKRLLEERDDLKVGYVIEKVRPQVMNICSRVNLLPTLSAKARLCQAEIAKHVANLMRAVMSLEVEASGASAAGQTELLAQYLGELPLPEDYELQELRTLTRMYMKELMQT